VAIRAGVVLQIVMAGETTLSAWGPENGCRGKMRRPAGKAQWQGH
jgi:hypothetical protein